MQELLLGDTGRKTTRLGFGCSSVLGVLDRQQSLALLETAFDAGIRHFDVSPMYGYGEAEACLGEFLARHPGQTTVTTKYGIRPQRQSVLKRLARSIARPILQQVPALKQRASALARSVAPASVTVSDRPHFTAAQARASLEASLAALKTDHIDVWLLHEASASDLADEDLLRLLEDLVKSGVIGSFGVGSELQKVPQLTSLRPEYCRVLQHEWSVFNDVSGSTPWFRIHHRSITPHFHQLHAALTSNAHLCRIWSDSVGYDLNQAEIMARLMMKASLVLNPESIVLFSSKRTEHIHANAALVDDTTLARAAERLFTICHEQELINSPLRPIENLR